MSWPLKNPKLFGLRLDSREAILTGGESGPAAIVGKPDESLLVDVIGYRNSVQMPPKSKLPDSEIAILTEWVRRGLTWPDSDPSGPCVRNEQPDAGRLHRRTEIVLGLSTTRPPCSTTRG